MLTILSGLAAGAAHVVTGPDHLAALAPIAAEDPARAARLGFRWGLGHGLGVVALGAVGMFAQSWIDVGVVSAWAEVSVGFVLVLVGGWAFLRASRLVVHAHEHDHGQGHEDHSHIHVHPSDKDHDAAEAHLGHSHAAFFVGALHGAAGTGHLLGLLPSLALPPVEAAMYLAAYFVAAVGAMVAFGGLMGALVRTRGAAMLRRVMYSSSAIAVFLGVYWVGSTWPVD